MADDVLGGASLQPQRSFLTFQQIFDKALTGVRTQGGPSVVAGNPRYRDRNGHACGVGHLIPDNVYDVRFDNGGFEAYSVTSLLQVPEFRNALQAGDVDVDNPLMYGFLGDLQSAHDRAFTRTQVDSSAVFMDVFEGNMSVVARQHKLTYTPPQS